MILVFLTTSLTFKYLGKNDYGIWVTIYSIISWVYLLDFGFSNVIKTKLPALLQDDEKTINTLISTIYVGMGGVSALIFLLYLIFNVFVSPSQFLNIDTETVNFNLVLTLNLLFSVLILFIGNFKSLFVGVIKTQIVEFSMMTVQLVIFITILVLYKGGLLAESSRLLAISLVFGLTNMVIGILFTLYFFRKNDRMKVGWKYFDLGVLRQNTSLGLKYFIIQICMVIIFSTDYLLITKYFGVKEVANYDIVLKIFQVPMLLAITGLSPFWSIFSKNYAEKNFAWIRKTLINYNFLFIFFIIGVVLLVLIINQIIYLWMNVRFDIPMALLISISVYITMRAYTAMYNYFLNGINKINLSLWLTVFGAVINIPVCILLIKMGYGVSGIVIGTCISILPTTICLPIQAFRGINKEIAIENDSIFKKQN